ncbi:hypothetical protein NM208_g7682 [Fusarium decemcellulare]|uniref:Uncharacterized protein n=1 Tax=Fusarium decemcellulare TaxID=57161 RepID=A0ACC1S884_9HYPO|nr:hypothetical protein NM208_g7682 [Fusarium decemcellulare]
MTDELAIPEGFPEYAGNNATEASWHRRFIQAWNAWGYRDLPHERDTQLKFGGSTTKRLCTHVVGRVSQDELAWGHITAVLLQWRKRRVAPSDFAKKAQARFPRSDVLKVEWNEDGPVITNLTLKRANQQPLQTTEDVNEHPTANREGNVSLQMNAELFLDTVVARFTPEVIDSHAPDTSGQSILSGEMLDSVCQTSEASTQERVMTAEPAVGNEPGEPATIASLCEALHQSYEDVENANDKIKRLEEEAIGANERIRELEQDLFHLQGTETRMSKYQRMCGTLANLLLHHRIRTPQEIQRLMWEQRLFMPEGYVYNED